MRKTILITGATDGIGLATAKLLASQSHHLLLHGRSAAKLERAHKAVSEIRKHTRDSGTEDEIYVADLSRLAEVEGLAEAILDQHEKLDVLINNAGVFRTREIRTVDGLETRFAVNTIAPYLLTKKLLPLLGTSGRVVNLSSAAQAPVDIQALQGEAEIPDDFNAYAQSKLALTMWTRAMAASLADNGPAIVAVNPGSMLGSKMVKEGFGVTGGDIGIGARILVRAALDDEFATARGEYFDNDTGRFAPPHANALNAHLNAKIVASIEAVLSSLQY